MTLIWIASLSINLEPFDIDDDVDTDSPNLIDIINADDIDIDTDNPENVLLQSPRLNIHDLIEKIKNNKNHFHVLDNNIESLNSKHNRLQILMKILDDNDASVDAITLQETWLPDEPHISHTN